MYFNNLNRDKDDHEMGIESGTGTKILKKLDIPRTRSIQEFSVKIETCSKNTHKNMNSISKENFHEMEVAHNVKKI